MSISQNFPDIRPTLNLDFANTKTLDPRITYTRASIGTYVDNNGVIQTATDNTPRFDHDPLTNESLGLLIEEARTNNVLRSDSISYATSSGSITVNTTGTLAPDGTFTAVAYAPSQRPAGNYNHEYGVIAPGIGSCPDGNIISIYAKMGPDPTLKYIHLRIFTSIYITTFNLEDGTFTENTPSTFPSTMTDVGNGWWRLTARNLTGSTATSLRLYIGDNTSIVNTPTGDEIYLWGLQNETGSFPTSYIPTPATFTSRASTATYYDANGVIQTAGVDVARDNAYLPDENGVFYPAGLLLEGSSTNNSLNSNTGNPIYPASGVSYSTSGVGLDGTTSGTEVVITSPQVTTGLRWSYWGGSSTVTRSFFVKVLSGSGVTFTGQGGSGDPYTWNISTKTYSSDSRHPTGGVEYVGNGWYRCWIGPTGPNGDNNSYMVPVDVGTYLFWGFQVETGSYPTSYIPAAGASVTRAADVSSSSSVTRSADVASITGSNFSSWYNQSEGTIFSESGIVFGDDVGNFFPSIYTSGYFPNRLWSLYLLKTLNPPRLNIGADAFSTTLDSFSQSPQTFKVAQAISNNDLTYSASANGDSVLTGTLNKSIINTTSIAIGSSDGAVKRIARLTYYPVRLSDSQLQNLTK